MPHREVLTAQPCGPAGDRPLARLPQWNDAPRDPVPHARFAGPTRDAGRLWSLLADDAHRGDTGRQASPALTALPANGTGTATGTGASTRVEVVLAHPERGSDSRPLGSARCGTPVCPPSRSTTTRDVGTATGLAPLREPAGLVDRTLYVAGAEAGHEEVEQAERPAAAVRAGSGTGSGTRRGVDGRRRREVSRSSTPW